MLSLPLFPCCRYTNSRRAGNYRQTVIKIHSLQEGLSLACLSPVAVRMLLDKPCWQPSTSLVPNLVHVPTTGDKYSCWWQTDGRGASYLAPQVLFTSNWFRRKHRHSLGGSPRRLASAPTLSPRGTRQSSLQSRKYLAITSTHTHNTPSAITLLLVSGDWSCGRDRTLWLILTACLCLRRWHKVDDCRFLSLVNNHRYVWAT